MSRFDWYQATVEEPPLWLMSALRDRVEVQENECQPLRGYGRAVEMQTGDGRLCSVHWGGLHDHPHVLSTGGAAEELAAVLRDVAPKHLVSRADVCADLVEVGLFDRVFSRAKELSVSHRVGLFREGDWDSQAPSRTFVLGAKSSTVRLVGYEKGMEQAQKAKGALKGLVDPNWVRLELRIRPPKRESKILVSMVPAVELWGVAGFSRCMAEEYVLSGLVPSMSVGTSYRPSDFQVALTHLVHQYGRTLKRYRSGFPSDESFGVELMRLVNKRS